MTRIYQLKVLFCGNSGTNLSTSPKSTPVLGVGFGDYILIKKTKEKAWASEAEHYWTFPDVYIFSVTATFFLPNFEYVGWGQTFLCCVELQMNWDVHEQLGLNCRLFLNTWTETQASLLDSLNTQEDQSILKSGYVGDVIEEEFFSRYL